LQRLAVGVKEFPAWIVAAKTPGALELITELSRHGYFPEAGHGAIIPEMVQNKEQILAGVRMLSRVVNDYRYSPAKNSVYDPEKKEDVAHYTFEPYSSFAEQQGIGKLFDILSEMQKKDGKLSAEVTDGFLKSLIPPSDFTEQRSGEFNQAINTLVSAFMVENGALSGCRGLLTPTFLRRVAENPVEYTRNLLEFGGLFGQALEQAGRDEQLRRLGVSEKIADLLSQPRGNLEEIAKILKGGEVGAVHILTGLAVAWPLAKDPKNTVRVAKSLEGMLKTSSGNLNHMLTHGLGFFFENNLVADAASFEAVATGLAGVSQRNASNEVWELMKKFMPPAYRDDAVPAMELGGELATFGEFVGEFGATNIPYLYTAFRRMKNGLAPPAELASSGITSSGSKGVRELKDAVRSFRRRLIADDRTLEVTNPLELDLLKALTRFEEGQWRSGEGLSGIAARLSSGIKSGAVAQAPAEYTRGTIRVARLDAQSLAEFQFAPDTSRVLEEVRTDVRAVKGKSVQQVVDESREAIITGAAAEIRKLEETIPRGDSLTDDDRRRQKGIQQKIDNYRRLISGIEGKKTAAELVETVASWEGKKDNPITTPILRRLLISHGLTQLSSGGREFLDAVESPLSDGIGRIIEFYDSLLRKHVLGENQDLPGHLKLPKPARKRAQGAITQGLLKQEYERRMNIKASGEDEFLMMPSRGVLGELSGTICDACWAGRSDILRGMPNMVPVIFVRSPDTPAERIAGATLLLEAQTAEGEKAIVIRGFNPLQNVITELNTQSFFESFADWLAPIARARGAKKILVVGGTRGGAMTNRPDIATYVGTAYGAAQDVALADQPQTTFNNYDIRNACKLVREIT
jgi:hypothetical protein